MQQLMLVPPQNGQHAKKMVKRTLKLQILSMVKVLIHVVRVELFLYFLLSLVLGDTPLDGSVAHTLMIPLSAVIRHEARKELRLFLTRNQSLNQRDIYANAIGDTTGANLVRMNLRDDMYLLCSAMRANA